jgi:hypothetical protein
MRLAELQLLAQGHLLQGGDMPPDLEAAIAAPAGERWAIYVEAYRLRLTEALATQYPALVARCGRPAFGELAWRFIREYPSIHRSIRDYGRELPALAQADGATAELRLRGELARFEWLLAAAFDAPEATACTVAELAGVAPVEWPTLRFAAVPSLQRLRTSTNAVAVWRAMRRGLEDGPAAAVHAEPAAIDVAPIDWLLVRPRLETEFRSLPADEAIALDLVVAGTPFAALCETLAASHGDQAALQAATWLKGWLTEGLLLRV